METYSVPEMESMLRKHFSKLERSDVYNTRVYDLGLDDCVAKCPDLNVDRVKGIAIDVGLTVINHKDEVHKYPRHSSFTFVILR
nr:hypothetical protein BdHM001_36120 [Bdellovibrio sp. HM001]